MANLVKNALPAHLKATGNGASTDAAFERKHHGKTQSHVVSTRLAQ
jgi:hypothetical protein